MASTLAPEPFTPATEEELATPDNEKLSWREIQKRVKNTRRLNAALSNTCRVPTYFTFRNIEIKNEPKTRLYFLAVPPNSSTRENTLMYVDLPTSTASASSDAVLKWSQLLDIQEVYLYQESFSKEEQLLRERKRLGSFGITAYDVDVESGRFVFPASRSLFTCNDPSVQENDTKSGLTPIELKRQHCTGTRIDTKLCPSNPELVAFVADKDIWVTHAVSGVDQRLTFAQDASKSFSENAVSAGVPPFVVQEEFDRYTGYWWQPHTSDGIYRILYEEVDECDVTIVNLVCPSTCGTEIERHRYPRSGEPNAVSVLKLLEFKIDDEGQITDLKDKALDDPIYVASSEYLVRAGWTSDSNSIWAQVLNRAQNKLEMLHIPLTCFCPVASAGSSEEEMEYSLNSHPDRAITTVYMDTSDVWINITDTLHLIRQENTQCIDFIIPSERSGFRHLYYVSSSLVRTESNYNEPVIIKEVQLTSGEWEVLGKEIWVDEERKIVYFMALKDTPLENHLYAVSYSNPGEVVRLTTLGFSHVVYMDQEYNMFASVYSSVNCPPRCEVYQVQYSGSMVSGVRQICTLLLSASLEPRLGEDFLSVSTPSRVVPSTLEGYSPPSLFSYQSASSHVMHGMIFMPHNYEEGKRYPTVLYVYGGPQVQMVSNAFKGMRYLRHHTMASLGYLVVAIDSRGSCNRGLQFEAWVKDRLGTVEIEDQVEGLMYLASRTNFIDLERVAIYGSSYGGYLSLMGLIQRPDVFKVAIAGAPVTSWELYDTGYTERYMSQPHLNRAGYEQGSVLSHVRNFPDQAGRLLIVHGLMDENVHFYHTSSLIDALIKAGKPYQLQVYPNERHGIRNVEASEHYETLTLQFLQLNL